MIRLICFRSVLMAELQKVVSPKQDVCSGRIVAKQVHRKTPWRAFSGALLIVGVLLNSCISTIPFVNSNCDPERIQISVLLQAINRYRSDHGIKTVDEDGILNEESKVRSRELSDSGEMVHYTGSRGPLDRLQNRGVNRRVVGEVIARVHENPDSLKQMIYQWTNNRRENQILLDPAFHNGGAGFTKKGDYCYGVVTLTD